MSDGPPLTLVSLWVGNELSYLERLSLTSAMAAGHPVKLFSYEPESLTGVPPGVELRNAAEVMPRELLLRYSDTGAVALGANFWRYRMLQQGLGCWVDLDLIFLRRVEDRQGYVLGWEHEGWLNNAILLAPRDSAFVRDLIEVPVPNRRPPWFGPKRSLEFYIRRLRHGSLGLEDMPWGTYAAGLVTYLVRKHALAKFASPPTTFFPVRWKDARKLYGPAEDIESLLTEETVTVHMWHSRLGELKQNVPPAGSYMAKMCQKFGIDA